MTLIVFLPVLKLCALNRFKAPGLLMIEGLMAKHPFANIDISLLMQEIYIVSSVAISNVALSTCADAQTHLRTPFLSYIHLEDD